jgi:hypothetical protein
MPTLIVSSALAGCIAAVAAKANPAAAASHRRATGRFAAACVKLNMSEIPCV